MRKRYQCTSEHLEKARTLAEEIREAADTSRTVEENIRRELVRRVYAANAERDASELCNGVKQFEDAFNKDTEVGALFDAQLDKILKDKTEAEQKEVLAGLLNACAMSVGQPAAASGESMTVTGLRKMIKTYVTEYALPHTGFEALMQLMEGMTVEEMEAFLEADSQAVDIRYTALALYIQFMNGELDGVPEEMGAAEIGAATAAAVYTQETMREGILGRIDWETVRERLKRIAGVALIVLLAIVTVKTAAAVGGVIFLFMQSVIGLGFIGTAAAVVLGLVSFKSVIDAGAGTIGDIAEKTGVDEMADSLFNWFTNNLCPAVKLFWQKLSDTHQDAEGRDAEISQQTYQADEDDEDETEPVAITV